MDRNSSDDNRVVPLGFGRSPEPATGHASRLPLVRIHVLGALRATTYLGNDILPHGRKARAMLGYLCLCAGESVARGRLSSLLWDRVPDRQARGSFRQALRELTAAMGPLAGELLYMNLDTVKLEPRVCWIDAVAVLSSEPPPPQSFRSDLATGGLLEDLDGITSAFDQWLLGQRTRFTEKLRLLFESELQQLGEADAAPERRAALARQVIAFEPTHEGAARVLMRAHSDMGERAQAIREYERLRMALRVSMDVEPSSETRALYQALRTFSGPLNWSGEATRQEEAKPAPVQHTGRLRVGVLPLQTSAGPAESLAFSLSREIAAGLSRFRWFDVITPASPAASNVSGVARKPLDYVVEGDLSGNEEKYRFSVRLMDVSDEPRPVWNDYFELAADALDQVNELVVAPVVARIDPVILFIEGQQPRPQHSGATRLVLQAMPLMYSLEREKYEEAGRLIAQAVEVDPLNAKAAAWGAYWHVWYVGQGWAQDIPLAFAKAQQLALRAVKLDPENAEAMGIHAHVCAFLNKDFDSALHYFDRALRLNPNLAFIWALSAPTYCYIGEPEQALQRLDRYHDLAPFDPYFPYWEVLYTIAYMFKGDYEKAVTVGRRNVAANPEFVNAYKPLIAALGHLGRHDEATPYIEKLLVLEPNFTVERFGHVYPFRKPDDRDRYMRGLALAGVPES